MSAGLFLALWQFWGAAPKCLHCPVLWHLWSFVWLCIAALCHGEIHCVPWLNGKALLMTEKWVGCDSNVTYHTLSVAQSGIMYATYVLKANFGNRNMNW
uniref:Secreted protein n=1 Tax=Rhipicephalus appendiculatus TaxID=34631 RepID=A0A131YE93_RHIAP